MHIRKRCNDSTVQLELEFAAMLYQQRLVQATYDLKGDRLEILEDHDKIYALKAYGTAFGEDDTLPNADAALRKHVKVKVDTKIKKMWPVLCACDTQVAEVVEFIKDLDSTLMPVKVVAGCKVRCAMDGKEEDLEDAEMMEFAYTAILTHRATPVQ